MKHGQENDIYSLKNNQFLYGELKLCGWQLFSYLDAFWRIFVDKDMLPCTYQDCAVQEKDLQLKTDKRSYDSAPCLCQEIFTVSG